MGTLGGGVSRYDGRYIRHYSTADGLPDVGVRCVVENRTDELWIGTPRGAARRERDRFQPVPQLSDVNVSTVLPDRSGRTWFGLAGGAGLACHDGDTWRRYTTADGLPGDNVDALLEDRSGQLWVGTDRGPARRDDTRFGVPAGLEDLTGRHVTDILEDRTGVLWFATYGPGVARYDGALVSWLTSTGGVVLGQVTALMEDRQGRIWMGTQGAGLSCYDGKGFTPYSVEDGLAGNYVTSLCEDESGSIWIGTYGGGVSRFDGRIFQALSERDGLLHDAVGGVLCDRGGAVWIASDGGLTRYRPRSTPPKVAVSGIIADRVYHPEGRVRIPSSQRVVMFEVAGRSLATSTSRMTYVYRLQGLDEAWTTTRRRAVEYQELSVGDYLFEVRAVDLDLLYSDVAAVPVSIVREPRDERIDELEQRVRRRTNELEAKNRALEVASAKLEEANRLKSVFLASVSHELRTPMNSIVGFAELLQANREGNLTERQLKNLATMERNTQSLLMLINEILDLSKIEAGRVDLEVVLFDLCALVQEAAETVGHLVEGKPVQILNQCDTDLAMETDRSRVGQILSNLLSNAAKFTEAGEIVVEAAREENAVCLRVRDTGIGIEPGDLESIFEEFRRVRSSEAHHGTGLGLAITRGLCHLLGGDIRVESAPGEGTVFTVRLPVILERES